MSDEPKDEPKTERAGTLEDIKSIADDIRHRLVEKAQSASAEARAAWQKLEPQVKERLQAAEHEIRTASDTATERLKGIYGELKASLQSLREKL